MLLRRFLFISFIILGISAEINSQTPVTTLRWDFTGVVLTEVNTYTQSVSIDGAEISLSSLTCQANGVSTSCSVSAPILATGTHTVVIAATKNGVTTETRVTGMGITGTGPAQPTTPRLVVTVTVAVGS
jgi:hypothetical protein